jgi:hypothetical protein
MMVTVRSRNMQERNTLLCAAVEVKRVCLT